MFNINKEYVVIFLLVVIGLWILCPMFEGFNANTNEFVPVSSDRYGLRGDLLRRSNITRYYIRPDRQIKLNASGGEMWESNYAPIDQGMTGCNKVDCPSLGYDNSDSCYKCASACPTKMKIPDIHPHVPN
jgi:hypothetical protein